MAKLFGDRGVSVLQTGNGSIAHDSWGWPQAVTGWFYFHDVSFDTNNFKNLIKDLRSGKPTVSSCLKHSLTGRSASAGARTPRVARDALASGSPLKRGRCPTSPSNYPRSTT